MIFTFKNTAYYIEDDILVIAFADSKNPDPKQYLILQKDLNDDEYYSYEFNSQAFSNKG